jgi:hypothetical protein
LRPVGIDASDVVRRVLNAADDPLTVEQIVRRAGNVLEQAEVERALGHWREQGVVVEDADNRWSWHGP